jgi:hypothetical protein
LQLTSSGSINLAEAAGIRRDVSFKEKKHRGPTVDVMVKSSTNHHLTII